MVKRKKEVEGVSSNQCLVVRDLPIEPEDSVLSSPSPSPSTTNRDVIGAGIHHRYSHFDHKSPSTSKGANDSGSKTSAARTVEDEKEEGFYDLSRNDDASFTKRNDADDDVVGSLAKQMEYLSTTSISSPLSKDVVDASSFVSWEQTRMELRALLGVATPSSSFDLMEGSGDSLEALTNRNKLKANECKDKLVHLTRKVPIELTEQAKKIEHQLKEKISIEKMLYDKENAGIIQAQSELDDAHSKLREVQHKREQLLQQKKQLKQQIVNYKEEAAQALEEFDEIEANMIQRVPRIKKNISLYATCTGIKWNYDDTEVYAGEVANSKQQVLRHFSIDPSELDDFELANKLWDVVGGEE